MLKAKRISESKLVMVAGVITGVACALFDMQTRGLIRFPGAGPEGFLPSQIGGKLESAAQEFINALERASPNIV